MTENINWNYYQIEIELKNFLSKVRQIKPNQNELLIEHIRKIKAYIFNIEPLKNIFIDNVKEFDKYSKSNKYKKLISNFTNLLKAKNIICLLKNNNFNPLNIPQNLAIYENTNEIILANYPQMPIGIENFFIECFDKTQIIDYLADNDSEYSYYKISNMFEPVKNINFFVISELNFHLNVLYWDNGILPLIYYKSALMGIIHDLLRYVEQKQIEYFTNDKKIIDNIEQYYIPFKKGKLNYSLPELAQISESERKVLNMVVIEKNAHSIAKALHLSLSTVNSHISNICKKIYDTGIKKSKKGGIKELQKFFIQHSEYFIR